MHSSSATAPSSAASTTLPPSEVTLTLPFASAAVSTPAGTTTDSSVLNRLIRSNEALESDYRSLAAEVRAAVGADGGPPSGR